MNFLNFLTSGASLFNFNLQAQRSQPLRLNTLLVQPQANTDSSSLDPSKPASSPKATDCQRTMGGDEKLGDLQRDYMSQLKNGDELIKQYLELNMKYISNQRGQMAGQPSTEGEKSEEDGEKKRGGKKKIKKVNRCGHEDKTHYAKGMCNNCYHKYGRTKKPWNCHHDKLYAAGMCQNCYINNYNRKKREERQQDGDLPDNEHQDIMQSDPAQSDPVQSDPAQSDPAPEPIQ